MFAQSRLSIGVSVGGYGPGAYPPPAYAQYQPACPGPGYTWVDGYWAPQQGRNVWIAGYWRAPVYTPAPRFDPPRYTNSFRGSDHDFDNHDRNRDRDSRDNRVNSRDNRGDSRVQASRR